MKTNRRYVSEKAICKLIKNDECCPSCHTDDEEGYRSLEEIELGKGRIACVCCAVRLNYEKWLENTRILFS